MFWYEKCVVISVIRHVLIYVLVLNREKQSVVEYHIFLSRVSGTK